MDIHENYFYFETSSSWISMFVSASTKSFIICIQPRVLVWSTVWSWRVCLRCGPVKHPQYNLRKSTEIHFQHQCFIRLHILILLYTYSGIILIGQTVKFPKQICAFFLGQQPCHPEWRWRLIHLIKWLMINDILMAKSLNIGWWLRAALFVWRTSKKQQHLGWFGFQTYFGTKKTTANK